MAETIPPDTLRSLSVDLSFSNNPIFSLSNMKIPLLYLPAAAQWPCTRYVMILVSVEPEATECDGKDCKRTMNVSQVRVLALGTACVSRSPTPHGTNQYRDVPALFIYYEGTGKHAGCCDLIC